MIPLTDDEPIIDLDSVELDKINIQYTDLYKDPIQHMSFIKFEIKGEDVRAGFKTGVIRSIGVGIPSIHEKFYPRDDKREFMQLTLDPKQPNIFPLKNFLMYLDNYFSSDNFKNKLFGAHASKYTYKPIIRTSWRSWGSDSESDTDEIDQTNIAKIPYVKLYFNVTQTSDGREVKTKIVDNKARNIIPAKTITEVTQYIKYQKPMKITICCSHVWAMRCADYNSNTKLYGVKLILDQIELNSFPKNSIEFSNETDLINMCKFIKKYKYAKKKEYIIEI
jgi:hypothetical protein